MELEKIRKELKFLSGYEAIIFGSYATRDFKKGSDIDVAVITGKRDRNESLALLKSFIGKAQAIYDIRIFELLPLKIQASVIADYIVLFGSEPEISEYFYHYRKLWADCKHRIFENQFSSYKEKIEAMRRFERRKMISTG